MGVNFYLIRGRYIRIVIMKTNSFDSQLIVMKNCINHLNLISKDHLHLISIYSASSVSSRRSSANFFLNSKSSVWTNFAEPSSP